MPAYPEQDTYAELIRGDLRVELEYIGEGNDGDYDPTDSNDEPLLRFSVSRKDESGEWEQVDDASYCTQLPATISEAQQQNALEIIMMEIPTTGSMKRVCERLSWLSPDDLAVKK